MRRIGSQGQCRVHFSAESDARRRAELRSFVDLPIAATTDMARYDRRSLRAISVCEPSSRSAPGGGGFDQSGNGRFDRSFRSIAIAGLDLELCLFERLERSS